LKGQRSCPFCNCRGREVGKKVKEGRKEFGDGQRATFQLTTLRPSTVEIAWHNYGRGIRAVSLIDLLTCITSEGGRWTPDVNKLGPI
jgi:hypothetical protein